MNMECGGSTPLSSGQRRLSALHAPSAPAHGGEQELVRENGAKSPHSKSMPPSRPVQSGAETPHSKNLPEATSSHRDTPHSKNGIDSRRWRHAPLHVLLERGIYMVTAGTFQKAPFFLTADRLQLLHDRLHACAVEFGWTLHAWAVLANHYHFVAQSPDDPGSLRRLLNKLHMTTAKEVNRLDCAPGRKVWFQYWDSRITFDRSYLARLHYVNQNPVRHGVAVVATAYPWCSAARFEAAAECSFQRTIAAMPINRLEVPDDF